MVHFFHYNSLAFHKLPAIFKGVVLNELHVTLISKNLIKGFPLGLMINLQKRYTLKRTTCTTWKYYTRRIYCMILCVSERNFLQKRNSSPFHQSILSWKEQVWC